MAVCPFRMGEILAACRRGAAVSPGSGQTDDVKARSLNRKEGSSIAVDTISSRAGGGIVKFSVPHSVELYRLLASCLYSMRQGHQRDNLAPENPLVSGGASRYKTHVHLRLLPREAI